MSNSECCEPQHPCHGKGPRDQNTNSSQLANIRGLDSFATQEAIEVIEAELGSGASHKLFEDFNSSTAPIAAASLGQVYKLKLKSQAKNGEEVNDSWWCRCSKHCQLEEGSYVAVKVQRPDMTRFVLRYII